MPRLGLFAILAPHAPNFATPHPSGSRSLLISRQPSGVWRWVRQKVTASSENFGNSGHSQLLHFTLINFFGFMAVLGLNILGNHYFSNLQQSISSRNAFLFYFFSLFVKHMYISFFQKKNPMYICIDFC